MGIRYWLTKHWFRLSAQGRHGLHSPFAYQFYEEVVKAEGAFYAFEELNAAKNELFAYHHLQPELAQLLFRAVLFLKPTNVLEATSTPGYSTGHLAAAHASTQVESLISTEQMGMELLEGLQHHCSYPISSQIRFSTYPPSNSNHDLLVLDARLPLEYLESLLGAFWKTDEPLKPVIVLYPHRQVSWWRSVSGRKDVSVTIDLFSAGFLFQKEQQPKQYFKLRF